MKHYWQIVTVATIHVILFAMREKDTAAEAYLKLPQVYMVELLCENN